MKSILSIFLISLSFLSFSQSKISGTVKDVKGESVFAVNVYLKSFPQKGVITDFDGAFNLSLEDINDTLIISFIGYKTKKIVLSSIDITKPIMVVLKDNRQTLEEVIVTAQDPISERFSVVKIDKMDVYLNPVSQGDPLKAITVLPASTSTDETANPSLRGSAADRSRVVLNGVPIYNPVRASNLNNQGFFSLFNTEILDKQYVYASNPPLTYGNTSAGLVEIQTTKNLKRNQLQLSAGLLNTGFFLSQKIKEDVSFVQVYGNYQFSDAYVDIQQEQLPDIKNFNSKDAGINFHMKIGKKAAFNSYNYFIDEQFNGFDEQFTYKGNVSTANRRIFTINNLKFYSKKGVVSINSGINNSKQQFSFGNIKSEQCISQIYSSVDYKWHLLENMNVQFGISHDYHRNKFNDSVPVYYYALSANTQNYFSKTSIYNHILEAYLYTNWDINEKFTISSGMRSNIPVENQKYYFSSQLGLKYQLNRKQSLLLNFGKYHNYAVPDFYTEKYSLLSSSQTALDYAYELKNTLLKAAAYFKNEKGEKSANAFLTIEKVNTFGLEFYLEHNFYKYFKLSFSNSFIDQKMVIDKKEYHGFNDFHYLVKTTIQYNNPKLFSLALTYISRPGVYYNEIVGSNFDNQTNFYEPLFSNDLYGAQYGNYNRLDISMSKYMRLKKNALIAFVSLNNIFNTKNENRALYDADYGNKNFDFYQFRTVYFGVVWQLNY